MKNISLIVAVTKNMVIGKDNKLAWHLPDDMNYFSNMTKGHSIIMGRKNWESIPEKYRPLPGRKNIVVTRNKGFQDNGATVVNSIEKAIEVSRASEDEEIFIIGGGEIYKLGFKYVDKLYITEIYAEVDGNTYFPEWNKKDWKEISRISHPSDEKHEYSFDYVIYMKNE
ncbi:MAG: dihydrofolate reductase [Bacteroidota bacterium]|jgi:dihydrofolate reductase|nr:dihydrofolate reductase [Bacteroidota bacterium]|tara:strand:+ start:537 stop:1043 length:507 start_codon:yes stop_codon:yes gene_type:complete